MGAASSPSGALALAVAVVVVVVLMVVRGGDALQCHQCTSYKDSLCDDPFHFEAETAGEERQLKTTEFLQECPSDREYTLCRKIYQNVRGEERVIRSCGWLEYKYPCYKTVLEEYNTYVCTCKGDGCNGASAVSTLPILLFTAAAISAMLKAKL